METTIPKGLKDSSLKSISRISSQISMKLREATLRFSRSHSVDFERVIDKERAFQKNARFSKGRDAFTPHP